MSDFKGSSSSPLATNLDLTIGPIQAATWFYVVDVGTFSHLLLEILDTKTWSCLLHVPSVPQSHLKKLEGLCQCLKVAISIRRSSFSRGCLFQWIGWAMRIPAKTSWCACIGMGGPRGREIQAWWTCLHNHPSSSTLYIIEIDEEKDLAKRRRWVRRFRWHMVRSLCLMKGCGLRSFSRIWAPGIWMPWSLWGRCYSWSSFSTSTVAAPS